MHIRILSLSFLLAIGACESPEEDSKKFGYELIADSAKPDVFQLPDSINTKLIIASCHNPEFGVQTIFMYTDDTKLAVKKIDYLNDSSSNVDLLEILKFNEFHSKHYNMDYIIESKSVSMIPRRSLHGDGTPQSKTFIRTDRD